VSGQIRRRVTGDQTIENDRDNDDASADTSNPASRPALRRHTCLRSRRHLNTGMRIFELLVGHPLSETR